MAKGDGSDSGEPLESNVDFAGLAARQQGVSAAAQKAFPLPLLGFVASLNGIGGGIVLGAGTVPSGITVSFTTSAGTISFNLSGLGALATVKCNLAGGAAPAVTDDSGSGYQTGSIWVWVAKDAYVCVDPAPGAAIWKIMT